VSLIAYQQQGFYNLNPVVLLVGLFPLNFLFGAFLVISLTCVEEGILRFFLRNQGLRTLGKISYGVYVLHWPIMLFLTDQWPTDIRGFWFNQVLFFASVALSSIAIAYLSFRYFESPILNLKNKLAPLN
jgi:peptidoglycan/LPS O-acetylase OafA/YrhL